MNVSTLAELTALALKFRDERDWKQFHNFKDMALSLSLEAAELLEIAQWKNGPDLETHVAANQHRVAEELSDVLYWVLEIASETGIDLDGAFREKMRVNALKYPIDKSRGSSKKYDQL